MSKFFTCKLEENIIINNLEYYFFFSFAISFGVLKKFKKETAANSFCILLNVI